MPKARWSTFTAEYKHRILREADACKQTGQEGVLLQCEGLHNSHLTEWRVAREHENLAGETGGVPSRPGQRFKKLWSATWQRRSTTLNRESQSTAPPSIASPPLSVPTSTPLHSRDKDQRLTR